MELELQKIELEQIKIQAELKALQNERSNRDGETVEEMAVEMVENDMLFVAKCNFPDCELPKKILDLKNASNVRPVFCTIVARYRGNQTMV